MHRAIRCRRRRQLRCDNIVTKCVYYKMPCRADVLRCVRAFRLWVIYDVYMQLLLFVVVIAVRCPLWTMRCSVPPKSYDRLCIVHHINLCSRLVCLFTLLCRRRYHPIVTLPACLPTSARLYGDDVTDNNDGRASDRPTDDVVMACGGEINGEIIRIIFNCSRCTDCDCRSFCRAR